MRDHHSYTMNRTAAIRLYNSPSSSGARLYRPIVLSSTIHAVEDEGENYSLCVPPISYLYDGMTGLVLRSQ